MRTDFPVGSSVAQGIIGLVATTAEPIETSDPTSHPNFSYTADQRGASAIRHILALPIVHLADGHVIGVLQICQLVGSHKAPPAAPRRAARRRAAPGIPCCMFGPMRLGRFGN
jgi:hypothetical protein